MKRLAYLLLFALLIFSAGCGNSDESSSPPPGQSVYRNQALGFQMPLPAALSTPSASACQPASSASREEVDLGSNIVIRVTQANVRTAPDALANFLAGFRGQAENTSSITVDGIDGIRAEYRLVPSGRFGIAIFLIRNAKLYTLLFEARDMAQCGGVATPALFDGLVNGFKFLS